MCESQRENFNSQCHDIFINNNQTDSERIMVNEGIASGSLMEPLNNLSDYEIQVKEETFNLFHRDDTISPVSFENTMKKELEDFEADLGLMETKNGNESEEETIATFITAAGQQLALYAVEDSEEIFAVAVYDESGEAPTNFQFLMKSDVEKLIGEGAVKTVKKTSQFKKQLYAVDEMNSMNSMESMDSMESNCQVEPIVSPQKEVKEVKEVMPEISPAKILKTEKSFSEAEELYFSETKVTKNLNFQPNETSELIYDNFSSENVFLVVQEKPALNKEENVTVREEIKDEIIEKSTVQYILLNEPPDSSDLTLDDIEELFKRNPELDAPKSTKIDSLNTKDNKVNIKVEKITQPIDDLDSSHETTDDHNDTTISEENETNFSDNCSPIDDDISTKVPSKLETSADILRIKRPRKQQLTTVNRADSEIIIQQAVMSQVDDDNVYENGWNRPKKRGRRKKKKEVRVKKAPYVKTRRKPSAPLKSGKKTYRIEVIDIDVEDVNKEIITLEDVKEKGSSDKENEVIMVGDSEDEDDDDDNDDDKEVEVPVDDSNDSDYDDGAERKTRTRGSSRSSRRHLGDIFKCQNCSKQFRQQRALDNHSRICPKSRKIKERISARTRRSAPIRSARLRKSSTDSNSNSNSNLRGKKQKQYECKNCHERFEVVVALARHVRLMHSLKKKINNSESDAGAEEFKVTKEKGTKRRREESPIGVKRTRRSFIGKKTSQEKKKMSEKSKRKERFNRKLKSGNLARNKCTRKINCRDCGRWFSSLALLLAHSLQHATKKIVSEKSKVQRCQRCKKVFRSRFLYIRHLRMHSSPSKTRKRNSSIIKQSSAIKTPLEKRGRPQKL